MVIVSENAHTSRGRAAGCRSLDDEKTQLPGNAKVAGNARSFDQFTCLQAAGIAANLRTNPTDPDCCRPTPPCSASQDLLVFVVLRRKKERGLRFERRGIRVGTLLPTDVEAGLMPSSPKDLKTVLLSRPRETYRFSMRLRRICRRHRPWPRQTIRKVYDPVVVPSWRTAGAMAVMFESGNDNPPPRVKSHSSIDTPSGFAPPEPCDRHALDSYR